MAKNMSNDVAVAVGRSALLPSLFLCGPTYVATMGGVNRRCILTLHETYSPFQGEINIHYKMSVEYFYPLKNLESGE